MSAINGSGDFDFEIGSWTLKHSRLKERLTGCTEWETFEGTADMRPVLGGKGNIEDNVLHFPSGSYRAIAIRSYDGRTGDWAVWWLASDNPHQLDVPVIGRFKEGRGSFIAQDTLRDQPVLVRFLWLNTTTDTPRWEQAMSSDNGTTWETNWTMDFTHT